MLLALSSTSGGSVAALSGLGAALSVLGGVQLALFTQDKTRQAHSLLLLATVIGVGLYIIAIAFGSEPLFLASFLYLLLDVAATVAALVRQMRLHEIGFLRPLRNKGWSSLATATFTGGLVLLVGAGVAIGVLLVGRGGSSVSYRFSSPYRVSGSTCANGACTVNECKSPAPCGLDNEGRLREGKPLDIVCQTTGKVATAPDGSESHVWDRLSSDLYVSDLFVEGTPADRFARSLPRCSEA